MKFKLFLLSIAAIAAIALGCVRLPSVNNYKGLPATPGGVGHVTSGALNSANALLPDASVTVTDNKTGKVISKPASPTHVAIQHAVNWMVAVTILGALAAVGFGAFLIYSGQILAGVKCVAGGLLLMIASIWFAYHWLLVVGLCLIGSGVYLMVVYWSQISPVLAKLETEISPAISDVTSKVEGLVSKTAAKVVAEVAPAKAAAPVAPAPAPAPALAVAAAPAAPHVTLG
jgi:hypothetical protein